MNKVCENPIQSATDMLKHMAVHSASRAFAPVVGHVSHPEMGADSPMNWLISSVPPDSSSSGPPRFPNNRIKSITAEG